MPPDEYANVAIAFSYGNELFPNPKQGFHHLDVRECPKY